MVWICTFNNGFLILTDRHVKAASEHCYIGFICYIFSDVRFMWIKYNNTVWFVLVPAHFFSKECDDKSVRTKLSDGRHPALVYVSSAPYTSPAWLGQGTVFYESLVKAVSSKVNSFRSMSVQK